MEKDNNTGLVSFWRLWVGILRGKFELRFGFGSLDPDSEDYRNVNP